MMRQRTLHPSSPRLGPHRRLSQQDWSLRILDFELLDRKLRGWPVQARKLDARLPPIWHKPSRIRRLALSATLSLVLSSLPLQICLQEWIYRSVHYPDSVSRFISGAVVLYQPVRPEFVCPALSSPFSRPLPPPIP